MRHAPLFAGINGFGIAADELGWEQSFHCEIDPFCQKIIQYYWPNSKPYYDIKQSDFTIHRGTIDILTGGFPCQPYSHAGRRKGTEDDRHLWPEMLRAIREIQPTWVVGENVPGLISWNGGLVFHEVQTDLEAEGYEVQPVVLNAASVGAPHKRDRVWFVAYNISTGLQRSISAKGSDIDENGIFGNRPTGDIIRSEIANISREQPTSHPDSHRLGIGAHEPISERGSSQKTDIGTSGQDEATANAHDSGFQTERPELKTAGTTGSGAQWTTPHTPSDRRPRTGQSLADEDGQQERGEFGQLAGRFERFRREWIDTHASNEGLQGRQLDGAFEPQGEIGGQQPPRPIAQLHQISDWRNFPTQSPLCVGDDGLPVELVRSFLRADSDGDLDEKEIERIISQAKSRWRQETIKAGGNAIVPQVALQIFKAIEQTMIHHD